MFSESVSGSAFRPSWSCFYVHKNWFEGVFDSCVCHGEFTTTSCALSSFSSPSLIISKNS